MTGTTGTTGTAGTGIGGGNTYGAGSTTAGPHDSNIANKLDPRVDSDMDNRARHGAMGGNDVTNPGPAQYTAGPHSSDLGNKMDPRVDSDMDNRGLRNQGMTGGTTTTGGTFGGTTGDTLGTTGGTTGATYGSGLGAPGAGSTNVGPHGSNIANKLDPRVDSDMDNRGRHEAMAGSSSYANPGPAQRTAGPHSSDLMNKMDPRVDSDMDGSQTVGTQRQY